MALLGGPTWEASVAGKRCCPSVPLLASWGQTQYWRSCFPFQLSEGVVRPSQRAFRNCSPEVGRWLEAMVGLLDPVPCSTTRRGCVEPRERCQAPGTAVTPTPSPGPRGESIWSQGPECLTVEGLSGCPCPSSWHGGFAFFFFVFLGRTCSIWKFPG